MNNHIIESIKNFFNKKIIEIKLLTNSFDINCFKIKTEDKKNYIVKCYEKKNKKFNAIKAEAENLIYLNKEGLTIFPKVIDYNDEILIIEYIKHNNIKPEKNNLSFVKIIKNIHLKKFNKFGFYFNTQIGGMKQINNFEDNWDLCPL